MPIATSKQVKLVRHTLSEENGGGLIQQKAKYPTPFHNG
jgi:hypothetical protein